MNTMIRLGVLALAVVCMDVVHAAEPPAPKASTDSAREELREAQKQLRELTRRIAELSSRIGGGEMPRTYTFRYLTDPDRAMVGVVFGTDREKGGLILRAVTPGGPADKAGLRSGDRVLSINGKPVPKITSTSDEGLGKANELVGKPKAGDKVTFTVERDGKRQDISAIAERRESWDWPALAGMAPMAPGMERDIQIVIEDGERIRHEGRRHLDRTRAGAEEGRRQTMIWHQRGDDARHAAMGELRRIVIDGGGGFFDLRLADLNPALGKYFGTSEGVLVLNKDAQTLPQVQPGDVILSIGGERTQSSGDVMRALSSRAEQKGVNVEVMRERQRKVLAVDVPEGSNFDVMFPVPPAPPAPPAAPRAPNAARAPAVAPSPPVPPTAPAPPPPPARSIML